MRNQETKETKETKEITISLYDLPSIAAYLIKNNDERVSFSSHVTILADSYTFALIEKAKAERSLQGAICLAKEKTIKALGVKSHKKGRLRQFVCTNEFLKSKITKKVFEEVINELVLESKIVIVGAYAHKCERFD